ncbi:bifunctional RecB family nuclease/DEAD/DEAH box helicase [Nocardia arizonensis]|uniref:bifunctional RecB family nuclease/DEAD/DEAH box helicase n=1 Tax=Nocardia arizonensis TaxID=1141647 RepID=UPI001EF4579E|nr:AAA domain-containing protein [Nocardia arizonensis]
MFGDRVVCTAADLVRAAHCEFALLRALDTELGLLAAEPGSPVDVTDRPLALNAPFTDTASAYAAFTKTASTNTAGDAHPIEGGGSLPITTKSRRADGTESGADEAIPGDANGLLAPESHGWLASTIGPIADRYGDPNRTESSYAAGTLALTDDTPSAAFGDSAEVVVVRRPDPFAADPASRVAAFEAAHAETVAAVRAGAAVIRGASFFDGEFACSCEDLVREGRRLRYRVHGVATPRRDPISTELELAACAQAVAEAGAGVAQGIRIHVGDNASDRPLRRLAPIHLARRRRLARIVADKLGELLPVQWGDPRFLACGHCPTCTAALTTARDLLLVAGLADPVRTRLHEAGVTTIDRLAAAESTVAGLTARTVTALRRQAEIQLRSSRSGTFRYTVIDPTPLAALPAPCPGDLALTVAETPRGRLRLAVGTADAPHRGFDVPADSPAARDAVTALVDHIVARRRRFPTMRVYYWTREVRDTLLRRASGYGAGEEVVDELLCEGVLVDLYPIVRAALVIGIRSYTLPDLRQFLAGTTRPAAPTADARDPAEHLGDAASPTAGSDTGAAATRSAGAPIGDHARTDDCSTVLRLRDWLLVRAAETETHVPPPTSESCETITVPAERPSSLEAALAEFAAKARTPEDAAPHPAALMAAALGYHRRERRPLWWAHADRLGHPVDEWPDAAGVLVATRGTVDTKWHHSPDRPTMRRYLTLTGRIDTAFGGPTTLTPGTSVLTFYERPDAAGRRATAVATVLGCSVDADFADTVRVEELLPPGRAPYDELPIAIAPGPPRRDAATVSAMQFAAQQLLVTLPDIPRAAIFDILAARPPRSRSAAALPPVRGDHAAAICAAIRDLDNSYVAVQGPPGTGKTATAARVIERLVTRDRWRIGVVALSHPTIENILDAIVEIGVLPELVAKKDVGAVAPEWAVIDGDRYPRFLANAVNGCVIGGAPADFADASLIPRGALDLLVIADAGRFPLAESIAVGASARNLLLIGDPVATAARAAHPEPVGNSALGALVDAGGTLPVDRGYFLDRTWRMHPRICDPISRLRYDDRLRANETVTSARHLDGVPPGIETVLVDHRGNTTESEAEAREVVRRVRALLGATWSTGALTRRLHPHDIFVVAPYGAQVTRIRTLLARAKIEDVLVGTPDRFRGREAAVVLVSLATSTPADAPYGVSALVSGDLIHAAVCRAMWKAVIIRSRLLTEYLPPTPEGVAELAAFLELTGAQPKQTPSPR